jgi:hypothetical protein
MREPRTVASAHPQPSPNASRGMESDAIEARLRLQSGGALRDEARPAPAGVSAGSGRAVTFGHVSRRGAPLRGCHKIRFTVARRTNGGRPRRPDTGGSGQFGTGHSGSLSFPRLEAVSSEFAALNQRVIRASIKCSPSPGGLRLGTIKGEVKETGHGHASGRGGCPCAAPLG